MISNKYLRLKNYIYNYNWHDLTGFNLNYLDLDAVMSDLESQYYNHLRYRDKYNKYTDRQRIKIENEVDTTPNKILESELEEIYIEPEERKSISEDVIITNVVETPGFIDRIAYLLLRGLTKNLKIVSFILPLKYFIESCMFFDILTVPLLELITSKISYNKFIKDDNIRKMYKDGVIELDLNRFTVSNDVFRYTGEASINGYIQYEKNVRLDGVEVPINEIHCPRNGGCKVNAVFQTTKSEGTNICLKFMNIGPHSGVNYTFTVSQEFSEIKVCHMVVTKVNFLIDIWLHERKQELKSEIRSYHPLNVIDLKKIDDRHTNYSHYCRESYDKIYELYNDYIGQAMINSQNLIPDKGNKVISIYPIDASNNLRVKRALSIKSLNDKKYAFQFGIESLSGLISCFIKVESTILNEMSIKVDFKNGYKYFGFNSINTESNLPIYWVYNI